MIRWRGSHSSALLFYLQMRFIVDAATRFGGMAGALYGNSRNGLGGEMGAGSDESARRLLLAKFIT